MGAKDNKAKEFVSDNQCFADIFNYKISQKEGKADMCKTDVCKAWEEQWLDGKAEGIEQGKEQLTI